MINAFFFPDGRTLEKQGVNITWWRKSRSIKCSRRTKWTLFEKLCWIPRNVTVIVLILRHTFDRDECQQLWHTFSFIARPQHELWHVHYVLTLMLQRKSISQSKIPKRNLHARVFRKWNDEMFALKCWYKPSEIYVIDEIFLHTYFFIVFLMSIFMFLYTEIKDNANVINHVSPRVSSPRPVDGIWGLFRWTLRHWMPARFLHFTDLFSWTWHHVVPVTGSSIWENCWPCLFLLPCKRKWILSSAVVSDSLPRPFSLLSNGQLYRFLSIKWPVHDVDHKPLSGTELKIDRSYISILPACLQSVDKKNSTFI